MKTLCFFFIFGILLSVTGLGQNKKIDSLRKVVRETKVDTVKGRTLCRLGAALGNIPDSLSSGLAAGKAGISVLEPINDFDGLASCYFEVGNIYLKQGKQAEVLNCMEKCLVYSTQSDNEKLYAMAMGNCGAVYYNMGNYPKALDCFQKTLKKLTPSNLKEKAICLMSMGNIYNNLRDYPKTIDYYQQALRIFEQMKFDIGISACLGNIGSVYLIENKYAEASEFYQKSLAINEKLGNPSGIGICLSNIGKIYSHKKDYLKALEYYQKSLQIHQQLNDLPNISIDYSNIGSLYLKMNQWAKSKEYADQGLRIATEIKHIEYIKFGALSAFQADSALGDWKSAFEHHKLYKQYSDSLNNETKAKEFGKIESKYEFEKEAEAQKRAEQVKIQTENEAKERRNNLQYLTIFAGIIGLFTGLLFLGRLHIPTKIMEIVIFAGLLITFEFLLILSEPYFEQYSGGIPFYKLGFNTLIAFGFAPLHRFLESRLKKRLVNH